MTGLLIEAVVMFGVFWGGVCLACLILDKVCDAPIDRAYAEAELEIARRRNSGQHRSGSGTRRGEPWPSGALHVVRGGSAQAARPAPFFRGSGSHHGSDEDT